MESSVDEDEDASNEKGQDSEVTSTAEDELSDEGSEVSDSEDEDSEEGNTEAEVSENSNSDEGEDEDEDEEEEEQEEEQEQEQENVVADMGSGWGRILFHPVRRGKRVIVDVCSSANENGTKGSLDRITLSSTTNKVLHFQARRSRWGDLWPCGIACGRACSRAR
jgi:ribosomal protein RSM22 (predicted rRNA methylase)